MTIDEANARWICCPMCDKKKCEREADDCDVKRCLENKSKKYEDLKDYSDVYRMSINELYETIAKSMMEITNRLSTLLDSGELYRPPVEIKRDIKHEKNPMRLKQLNKELNESYKAYRKKGREE